MSDLGVNRSNSVLYPPAPIPICTLHPSGFKKHRLPRGCSWIAPDRSPNRALPKASATMHAFRLLVSCLVGEQQLQLCEEQPQEVEVYAQDDEESLMRNICDQFDVPYKSRLLLYYEKIKDVPDDATEYQLISANAVVGKAHQYPESRNVGVLMMPLQDGVLQGTSAASTSSSSWWLWEPVISSAAACNTAEFGCVGEGGISGSSSGAGARLRTSSSAGASMSYSHIKRAKSEERRKQAGVSSALDAAPSPVGRGRGKSREQAYALCCPS